MSGNRPDNSRPRDKHPIADTQPADVYRRDAEQAQALVTQLRENPLEVNGHPFRWVSMSPVIEGDRYRPIFQELQKVGLCTLVPQEREHPDDPQFEAMYIDDRLDDGSIRDLTKTINDASRVISDDQTIDLAQVTSNVLSGGNFPEAASISEEYLNQPDEPA